MHPYMVLEVHDECLSFRKTLRVLLRTLPVRTLYRHCGSQLLGSSLRGLKFVGSILELAAENE